MAEKIEPYRIRKFFEVFELTNNVSKACESSGISRDSVYRLKKTDETFAERWNNAQEIIRENAEAALYHRGVFGVDSYVVSQGKLVYLDLEVSEEEIINEETGEVIAKKKITKKSTPLIEKKYSDRLLEAFMRSRDKRYRQQDIVQKNIDLPADEMELDEIERLLRDFANKSTGISDRAEEAEDSAT